jgi:hypothetical protein
MSTCKFEKQIPEPIPDLILKAESLINAAHGSFIGDENSGSFIIPTPLGEISGIYKVNVNAKNATIEILEKPFLISCNIIENEIDKYFGNTSEDNDSLIDEPKYFLRGIKKCFGPFNIQELIAKRIEKGNYIWYFPLGNWTTAGFVQELSICFKDFDIADKAESEQSKSYIHWGDWKKDGCTKFGYRQNSSIIWGLEDYPREKWGEICYATPITNINGFYFDGPDRCVDRGYVWGEVDVPDPNCGEVPPNPADDNEVKQCSLMNVRFDNDSTHNYKKSFTCYFNLCRTPTDQKYNNCHCNSVLNNDGLYVRITATENNLPAKGQWVFNDVPYNNEFPFGIKSAINCVFVPLYKDAKPIFYANFYRKNAFGQRRELVVEPGNNYETINGGIVIPKGK